MARVVDEQISPDVKVRVYQPYASPQSLPLALFSHGGGWIAGNLDTEDHECRVVCSRVRCIVVSIDYRLCPDVKFPVPIEDCWTAFQWAQQNAVRLGADSNRFILWGGSAGAGLAIATTYRAVQNKQPVAGLVVMASFSLHPDAVPEKYRSLHTSYQDNAGPIPVIRDKDCHATYKAAGARPPYKDHSWFPQTGGAEALRGFPPTYIYNTDLECMRDDGRVLEAELKENGIPVKRDVQPGLPHYFWVFPIQKGGEVFRDLLVNGFTWVLEQSKPYRSSL